MTKPRIKATRISTERLKFTNQLAKHIKAKRTAKRLTQEELAHRAGLNSAYIGHMERGKYSPTLYSIWKIAKALDMSLVRFLSGFPT